MGSIGVSCREKDSLPATLPQSAIGAKLLWLGDLETWLPQQPSAVVVAWLGWAMLPTAPLLCWQEQGRGYLWGDMGC